MVQDSVDAGWDTDMHKACEQQLQARADGTCWPSRVQQACKKKWRPISKPGTHDDTMQHPSQSAGRWAYWFNAVQTVAIGFAGKNEQAAAHESN